VIGNLGGELRGPTLIRRPRDAVPDMPARSPSLLACVNDCQPRGPAPNLSRGTLRV